MENQNHVKIGDAGFKFNNSQNFSKSFGFHIPPNNTQILVVAIKRLWKRRENVTNYIRKKSLRRKLIKNQNTKIKIDNVNKHGKKFKSINPEEFTGDRKWCWDEYQQHIGVPTRIDTHPILALTYLRMKRYQRLVTETRNLRSPQDPESVLLTREYPVMKCLCPDKECFCSNKSKNMPLDLIVFFLMRYIPCLQKLFMLLNKGDVKSLRDNFAKAKKRGRLKKGAEKKIVMQINRDLCMGRCPYCHIKEELQGIEYLPEFMKPFRIAMDLKRERETPAMKKKEIKRRSDEIKEDDDRICNEFSCTVSSQTDEVTDGELSGRKFSHLLYSTTDESFLPDLRGQKLQISQYKHVSSEEPEPDIQDCVRQVEKLLDVKEMKNRLTKFISSIYEIKDPGVPLRTCATQVPWRQRIYDSIKYRAPNRCGDKDFEKLPIMKWTSKIEKYLRILEEPKQEEQFEEDENNKVCPCCELFLKSDIDKETLLDDIRNVLTLPGDERILKSDIVKSQAQATESGHEGDEDGKKIDSIETCPHPCCDQPIKKNKDNTELKNEGNDNMNNAQFNDKESVDKNILETNETNLNSDNSKVSSTVVDGETDNTTEEISNVKKTVKCDFLRRKKSNAITSKKSVTSDKNDDNDNDNDEDNNNDNVTKVFVATKSSKNISKNDTHGIEINPILNDKSDEIKRESNKALSGTDIIIKKSITNSKILKEKTISSIIQNTSDNIVHQLNTSYKKASSVFSSLFKWLFDRKSILSQIKNKTSLNSVSKEKSSTDTKLNERDSKASEREVFSMRYTRTNSTIGANNSTSSGLDK